MDNGNGKRKSQVPIWQKNLQSRQVPQKPTNAERTVRTSNQTAYKRQPQSSKGNGCMCIDKTNHYEFTYDIDGDTLKVDYALDYVTDCEYTYTADGGKMTLVGGNGRHWFWCCLCSD